MRSERLDVVRVEEVGPYRLLRLGRGGLEPGHPRPVLHAPPAGPAAAAADEPLPRPAGRARLPRSTRSGPGRARSRARRAGASSPCSGRSATASASTSERPLLVGGGIGIAPFPYLSERLEPPAGRARLPDGCATRRRPRSSRTPRSSSSRRSSRRRCRPGHDVLACGPEPMLRAVARSWPRALSSPGRRRWPAATAPATAAPSRSTGGSSRLCVDGPVLDGHDRGLTPVMSERDAA